MPCTIENGQRACSCSSARPVGRTVSYRYRIHFQRIKIKKYPLMFYHAVTEHLPENIAPELRQCGVDEQILFFQRFGQRAAWAGILLFYPRVFHKPGNDLQRTDGLVLSGCRLPDFLRHGSQHHLSRCLRVAEIHPVEGVLLSV